MGQGEVAVKSEGETRRKRMKAIVKYLGSKWSLEGIGELYE